VDPKLTALAVAAENGEPCPPVHVLTAASLILGTPAAGAQFAELLRESASQELWGVIQAREGRGAKDAYVARLDALRPTWQTMADTDSGTSVLTLADARVWPASGGDGVLLPAVRVRLNAIEAWWFGDGKRLKAPREHGWFFGVSFPLPSE
jgi:hypothetical protein